MTVNELIAMLEMVPKHMRGMEFAAFSTTDGYRIRFCGPSKSLSYVKSNGVPMVELMGSQDTNQR